MSDVTMTDEERDALDRPACHETLDTTDRMNAWLDAIGRDWAGNKGQHQNPPKRLVAVYDAIDMCNARMFPWVREDREGVIFFYRTYDPEGDEDYSCWIEVSRDPVGKPAKRPKFAVRTWDRYDIYHRDKRGKMKPRKYELTEIEVACTLAAAGIYEDARKGWERGSGDTDEFAKALATAQRIAKSKLDWQRVDTFGSFIFGKTDEPLEEHYEWPCSLSVSMGSHQGIRWVEMRSSRGGRDEDYELTEDEVTECLNAVGVPFDLRPDWNET